MGPQHTGLRRKPHIIVATPGRLLDHVEQGTARLGDFDRPGARRGGPHARHGLHAAGEPHPPGAAEEAADADVLGHHAAADRAASSQQFMNDPLRIDITPEGKAAHGISHRLYMVEPENKKACLLALLHQELGSTLVFIRRKSDAEWLSARARARGASGGAHPLRPLAGAAGPGPPGLPRGRAPHPGGDRHRRPRPRHPPRRPHHQLRHAGDRRGLHPPRRPHRPRHRHRASSRRSPPGSTR